MIRTTSTRAIPAAAALLGATALSLSGCSSSAQKPVALGGASASSAAPAPATSPASTDASGSNWVANPVSIALPAGLAFTWNYTPSDNTDVDQAVEVAEDINKGEIAGIGDSPQNPNIIDFAWYATGETLAWINSTFQNYAQGDGTWTGAVRYYKFITSDFSSTGTGASGIVQYCGDATGMYDVVRSSGAKTSEGSDNFILFTMKLTKVAGGWQAGNFTALTKDLSACAAA